MKYINPSSIKKLNPSQKFDLVYVDGSHLGEDVTVMLQM